MAPESTPNYNTAIDDFKSTLKYCTMRAACGRPYVLVTRLKEWLISWSSYETTQAGRLLQVAYSDKVISPLNSDEISFGEDCSLLVFSLLIELGLGNLIDRFQRYEIVDRRLPIDIRTLEGILIEMGLPNAEKLAVDFDQSQWRFCAANFDLDMCQDYVKNMIVPICRKKKINMKGGTAQLWRIAVQEEFVDQKLKAAILKSGFNDSTEDNLGYCYEFALKTFKDGNKSLYMNEKEAFLSLRNHDGIIQYLGDYIYSETQRQREGEAKTTFNILLEFAEFDLDEYFAGWLPPVLQIQTEEFWGSLFEIVDAVECIHNRTAHVGGVVQEYYGWHADIKPDNILSVQGKFKLADLGFAKIIDKAGKNPKGYVWAGTETYGAPECHQGRRGTSISDPQAIDIWSLGCVFSIAATWVVLGYQGVRQFGRMREKAIRKITQEELSQQSSRKCSPALTEGDYFHDGQQVLADVTSWHALLRSASRKTDLITSQVLDQIDQKMLLENVEKRRNAKDIYRELRQILILSQSKPPRPIPESVVQSLLEFNEYAPPKANPIRSEKLS